MGAREGRDKLFRLPPISLSEVRVAFLEAAESWSKILLLQVGDWTVGGCVGRPLQQAKVEGRKHRTGGSGSPRSGSPGR